MVSVGDQLERLRAGRAIDGWQVSWWYCRGVII